MKKIFLILLLLYSQAAICQLANNKKLLPSFYGIKNDGSPISQQKLNNWLSACMSSKSPVYFPAGTYCLPVNFEYDFGNTDLLIKGQGSAKTILTTYYNAATNFAVPEKIDLSKPKPPKNGIYQADGRSRSVHPDFMSVSEAMLDSYIAIKGKTIRAISLKEVKDSGYLTELDTREPDPGIDGIYVVAKHPLHDYGGGNTQLKLNYPGEPLYLQGTVLLRKNGYWSRYYSSVAFISTGNFSVKNISFRNFRPYLFLPSAKKGNTFLKTRDHFIIDQCRFEQTQRIVATMIYAGIQDSMNWYKASSYYPIDFSLSFKNFTIRNSEFSYIHESIVWGPPPSFSFLISNNNIHDCYTNINCFYLLQQYNTSIAKKMNSRFRISNNSFIRIRALNPGSENTVQLIRTFSNAIITNNIFIDCTGIQLYLDGNAIVTGNTIKTYMTVFSYSQFRPPVILVKIAGPDQRIDISGNKVWMGMMGSFIANESQASFNVSKNKLLGPCSRSISNQPVTGINLDNYKTYIVKDLTHFRQLAGNGNYDETILAGNTVYYNKRLYRWETAPPGLMYLYSEVNRLDGHQQTVRFANNEIEAENLTRIQKSVSTAFKAVSFENNSIRYCNVLNSGNDNTVIGSYKLIGNSIQDGSLVMNSLGDPTNNIQDLIISGNTFYKDPFSPTVFYASKTLRFENNTFTRNEAFNNGNSERYTGSKKMVGCTLNAAPGQQMMVRGNRFITGMHGENPLLINNPDIVIIAGNSFDLRLPTGLQTVQDERNAISFHISHTAGSIDISNNIFSPEKNKRNYLVNFNDDPATITNFTITKNKVLGNAGYITKTINGAQTYFINYYKGKNAYPENENMLPAKHIITIH